MLGSIHYFLTLIIPAFIFTFSIFRSIFIFCVAKSFTFSPTRGRNSYLFLLILRLAISLMVVFTISSSAFCQRWAVPESSQAPYSLKHLTNSPNF